MPSVSTCATDLSLVRKICLLETKEGGENAEHALFSPIGVPTATDKPRVIWLVAQRRGLRPMRHGHDKSGLCLSHTIGP